MAAVKVDQEKCSVCRICTMTCPEPGVIKIEDKQLKIDSLRCKACFVCASVCPKKALRKDED
ncbi:4Fe-4S dicluster domain-containing protein [Chitinispirillales bacterium ANBcel5]|uniref:4Fe-4S dicluster domain-containing protein n=1 Tax=Cellulosispirillum alkaliphilum TaxID=3039283 RepID=UPI002A597B33|nr:4Fe-4S dicluster domain-containing protein [Chitinispirillales bacterium ANBcel5]